MRDGEETVTGVLDLSEAGGASYRPVADDGLPPEVAGRFEIREVLGEGGMGVVVRAYDRARRHDVALKSMRRARSSELFRFKREFRTLADIVHPNLVTLYELFADGDRYWFSMELIDGSSFLRWVRPYELDDEVRTPGEDPGTDGVDAAAAPTLAVATSADFDSTRATADSLGGMSAIAASADGGRRRQAIMQAYLRPDRLRPALAQLAQGVAALHDAGRLHCDLKPSNVLIEASGGARGSRSGARASDARVVVCDFGLAVHLARAGDGESGRVAGTPAYMSPEQAAGGRLSPASDWYSFGCMLYEALAGLRPFEGTGSAIVEAKQIEPPREPPVWDRAAEPELRSLAMALLEREPEKRPGREEVLEALGVATARRATTGRPLPGRPGSDHGPAERLVGRESERCRLLQAFERGQENGVTAVVSAPSGLGKSTLVEAVREEVEARGALWLHGRCYERESVPYKALDALVDGLSSHLAELEESDLRAILPADIASLVRLFPVLGRVGPIAERASAPVPLDQQELRNRAFDALREILDGLAGRQPTVVFIDDLQWGDLDSEPFLSLLAHDRQRPRVLFLSTCRAEELDAPLMQQLLAPFSSGESSGTLELIELSPLRHDQACELVRSLRPGASDEVVERIARDAAGNPFLASELALATTDDAAGGASLDDVLRARVAALEPEARDLVTVAAVAGRPLPVSVVGRAAGVGEEARALAALRSARLVRAREIEGSFWLEPYHDRVREAVVAGLDEEALRRLHRRLARSLESTETPDVLALVDHWYGAGDNERAGNYALTAAELAESSLAFDRAAALWAMALETLKLTEDQRRDLLVRRATALQFAGDLELAAGSFGEAACGADRARRIDLQRRQCELLLHGGLTQRGFEVAKAVLGDIGVRVPRSRLGAMLSVLMARLRLRLRGLDFDPRPAEQIDSETLLRIDVLASTAGGMALVDPMRGSAYQMKRVIESLEAGEPRRAVNALIFEIGFRSSIQVDASIPPLIEWVRGLADAQGPATRGLMTAMHGLSDWCAGNFESAWQLLREGRRELLESDAAMRWHADISATFELGALMYLGELRELSELVPSMLRDARSRGNEFLVKALLAWRTNIVWLAADDVETARDHVTAFDYLAEHSEGFQIYDFYVLNSRATIELYADEPAAAHRLVTESWGPLKRANMMRLEWSRIEGTFLRGRTALALAAAEPARRRSLLRDARRCARLGARGSLDWGRANRALLLACAAVIEGDEQAAVDGFSDAASRFDAMGMKLHAAVARRRRGELVGGDEGAAAIVVADDYLGNERVARPEQIAATIAPMSRDR